jgi:glycosyltransferase involved in cell wall biosynthesis/LmbE family N-acetylglucosaminyl deacetylase
MSEKQRNQTIGVCVIAKNEELLIGRMLESCKGADQIVVVDTGSIDRTISIAKEYGAETFTDFVWCDDFSLAQNHAKSKMRTDWILSIDCDEILDVPFEEVRKAIEFAKDTVRVQMSGEGAKLDFGFPRLFRNTPDIYWCKSIHKHLNIPGEGEHVGNVKIIYGRSPTHDVDVDRSLRMLERAVETGEDVPRNSYYLGREYWYKQRYQDAIDVFKRYVNISERLDELADAYLIMAQCYCALRMPQETSEAALQAVMINPNFKEAIQFVAEISLPENKPQWERMARYANNEGVLWKRTEVEPMSDTILIATHNDDESLFAAYTIMRERPLVIIVTDSYIQPGRCEVGCDAMTRRQETIDAMDVIGCAVVFLGIKDTELTQDLLSARLAPFRGKVGKVYAPAIQGGNKQHDMVGYIASRIFDNVSFYCGYSQTELYTTGTIEIKPTMHEQQTKFAMLSCYKSQLNLKSTLPHFEAVINKSEWLL